MLQYPLTHFQFSLVFPILDIACKGSDPVRGLVCLASFTECYVVKVHPQCSMEQCFVPVYDRVVFQSADGLHLLCPFIPMDTLPTLWLSQMNDVVYRWKPSIFMRSWLWGGSSLTTCLRSQRLMWSSRSPCLGTVRASERSPGLWSRAGSH